MINISKYFKVSSFAPTQWVGITDDNQGIYIRYRNENLKLTIGDPPVENNSESRVIVHKKVDSNDSHTGRMKSKRMVNLLEYTNTNIDFKSERSRYDEDLRAVWDDMAEYTRDIDVDS